MAKSDDKIVKSLIEKFNLKEGEDLFTKKGQFRIITRGAIDRIAKVLEKEDNISFRFTEPTITPYGKDNGKLFVHVVFHTTDKDGNILSSTTGEACNDNVRMQGNYLLSMAEKRGRSRAVLKYSGLYDEGFYGEDEADDFEEFVRSQKGFPSRKRVAKIQTSEESTNSGNEGSSLWR